ncbi:MAG: SBBP repeat-containing protein [Candidatus Kapaibacterium sp.]
MSTNNKRNNRISYYIWVSVMLTHILIFNNLSAQYQQEWIKKVTGTGSNSSDYGNNIAFDKQNNVYVAGYVQNSGTYTDYFLMKISPAGHTIWSKTYNGTSNNNDQLISLEVDDVGNAYVTGNSAWVNQGPDCVTIKYDSSGNFKWVGIYGIGDTLNNSGKVVKVDNNRNVYVFAQSSYDYQNEDDLLLIKYDSLGLQKWVRRCRGANVYNFPSDMVLDKSGNIYVTGSSIAFPSGWDYLTIKYSPEGDSLWSRRYDNNEQSDSPTEMAIDSMGNICITGYSINTGINSTSLTTIKYDSAGVLLWEKKYQNNSLNPSDIGNNIGIDRYNNIYVAGYSTIGPDIVSNRDYITIRYKPNGDTTWVRRYNGTGNNWDETEKLTIDRQCNVFVTGVSYGNFGATDYFTISYDTIGNVRWSNRYNGPSNDYDHAKYIALDNAQNLYITGSSFENVTGLDLVTIKYSKNVGIQTINENIPDSYVLYQNYPNPFNPMTKINFDLPKEGFVSLKIYDITGREIQTLVNEVKQAGKYKVDFNGSALSSGVYFYRLQSGELTMTKSLVLIR